MNEAALAKYVIFGMQQLFSKQKAVGIAHVYEYETCIGIRTHKTPMYGR